MTTQKLDAGRRDNPAIGIVGLGSIGTALATSLLERGYAVSVWNRTKSKATRLTRRQPAHVARSLEEVARRSDVLLACLTDHSTTMEVVAHEPVAAALRDKLLLQTATVTSREACELAAWAGENAIAYLDCQILDYADDVQNGAAIRHALESP